MNTPLSASGIHVNDSSKLLELQQEFSSSFPYLKLEFLNRDAWNNAPSAERMSKQLNSTIGQSRKIRNNHPLCITATMTVSELERAFREIYGIDVQLYRKSGSVWLETTVTENWTLEQQNSQGKALATLTRQRPSGPDVPADD